MAVRRVETPGARRLTSAVILLAIGSGAVDAFSFAGLGAVFASVMTGNLVLLGVAVVHARLDLALSAATAIAAYAAGVFGAAFWLRRARPAIPPQRRPRNRGGPSWRERAGQGRNTGTHPVRPRSGRATRGGPPRGTRPAFPPARSTATAIAAYLADAASWLRRARPAPPPRRKRGEPSGRERTGQGRNARRHPVRARSARTARGGGSPRGTRPAQRRSAPGYPRPAYTRRGLARREYSGRRPGSRTGLGGGPANGKSRLLRQALTAVPAAQVAVLAGWLACGGHPAKAAQIALLALSAFAMGVQSAGVNTLPLTGAATTYLTGTLTTLTTELATSGVPATMRRRFAVLAAALVGAGLSTVLLTWLRPAAPALPLAAALTVLGLLSRDR